MYFPQVPAPPWLPRSWAAGTAGLIVPAGKTKLATLVCAEAQGCTTTAKVFADSAQSLGYQVVYQAQVSLAQPDFTAQCLAARNAGAQVIFIALDTNSVGRISTSCARQGYRPTYSVAQAQARESLADDPNLEGAIAPGPLFPAFLTGTPALDEFQHAVALDGAGIVSKQSATTGWLAGKLFEKAAATLPEPPTSQAILDGLWSIKDDSLGGIAVPLSFNKDQPAQGKSCWFNMEIKAGKWFTNDGGKLHCEH
jgi:branched-chain amino acid transport system substrate-binding protein